MTAATTADGERADVKWGSGGNNKYDCCRLSVRKSILTARVSTELTKQSAAVDCIETTPQPIA